jgi:broad specificity phosphatase PhoE
MGATLPGRVLLVRHGATEWSVEGRHTGSTDVALTTAGRQEAEHLGAALRRLTVHEQDLPMVYSSPRTRALDTARIAMPEAIPEVLDALREVDYGLYEGLTTAAIRRAQPTWELFTDGCPDGESLGQAVARADGFCAKLERIAAGRTVIAFTHGHFSRVLTVRLLGLPGSSAATLFNDTASIAVIEDRRGQLVLRGWNITV